MREDLLRRIYHETDVDLGSQNRPPAPGFSSVDKTWRFARRVDPWITKEEVAAFIRKQSIDQDLQRARRLGTFLTTGALEQIEIDLADFTTKAARGDRVSMYGWEQGGARASLRPRGHRQLFEETCGHSCGQQGRHHDRAGS